jgi:hypothetical protein
MKISKEANESLNVIRQKVMRKAIDINDQEFLHLDLVHREITKQSTGKEMKVSKGCSSCINNAVNILYNFVMFHEEKHEATEKSTPSIEMVSVPKAIAEEFKLNDLNVSELKNICDGYGIKYHHKAGEKKLIELITEYHESKK